MPIPLAPVHCAIPQFQYFTNISEDSVSYRPPQKTTTLMFDSFPAFPRPSQQAMPIPLAPFSAPFPNFNALPSFQKIPFPIVRLRKPPN
jgi:hypothetical protein